jgi:prophage DNA circulation protein
MSWFEELQPASFGGVPFGVTGGQLRVGRRNAVHEYPFKDDVWVEDLGRAARRITLVGFLVENAAYGGSSSAIQQREQLIAAIESPGKNTLVHPTLGELQVSCLDSSFTERWDRGRMFEFALTLIEGGDRTFPADDPDTSDLVDQTCSLADVAAGVDFTTAATSALTGGSAVLDMAIGTTSSWGSIAQTLAGDATNLMNSVGNLQGSFGRFFGGNLKDITGALPFGSAFATVSSLIASGSVARAAVSAAVSALNAAASGLGLTTIAAFVSSAQGVAASLLAATTDPADSVRVLGNLAVFAPSAPTPMSPVGTSMASIQTACGNLFRRAAVVSVARGSAKYQPSSYDDAAALRTTVTGLLDAEIEIAGNSGEDATYNALRSVRAAVVQDLTTRGANLAKLVTITTGQPVPALALAQREYRDGSRADELIAESNCVHPAFMPTSFRALAQ